VIEKLLLMSQNEGSSDRWISGASEIQWQFKNWRAHTLPIENPFSEILSRPSIDD
jgi:hypothetical protein